ncbi:MAG: ThiF family adenylyltransferase [Promethearchaeota archaeon]
MNKNDWTTHYKELTERNIGIISIEEQEILRKAHVGVFGVGGLGCRIAEILVRSGCENLSIIDRDTYSISNLNTQFITKKDIGSYKVDVLAKKFQEINPNVTIHTYKSVDENNINSILESMDVGSLSLDGPIGSIIVARECRRRKIPLVEAWSLPYLFAWWFTEENKDYESCYKLDTNKMSYSGLKSMPNLPQLFRNRVFSMFEKFPNFHEYYGHENETVENMRNGSISLRSFAPFVFLSGGYLAFELIFTGILKRKEMILAPEINSFNVFDTSIESFRL